MLDSTAPHHPDLALHLPADAYWHLVRTLRLALPPLGDSPEDLLRRDRAAIARIAALAPANAAEADLAAQFVAASEQWRDCLRLAQDPTTSPEMAPKCRAQALAMMRQANAALRLLLRLQDRRGKLEADDSARDRAAWTEHCAIGLMAEALSGEALAPARAAHCSDAGIAEPAVATADPSEANSANPDASRGEADARRATEAARAERIPPSQTDIQSRVNSIYETPMRRPGPAMRLRQERIRVADGSSRPLAGMLSL